MLGIGLKVLSVGLFLIMATLIKASGPLPPGQLVFFRSLFAVPPILIFLWWSGALRDGFGTKRPGAHLLRGFFNVAGMMCGFYGLTHLPLPEAVALGYTMPLLTVMFGALFLKEVVRIYRWSAVLFGFVGVAIIMWPRLSVFSGGFDGGDLAAFGALAALMGAVIGAIASLLVRSMVKTERSATIVFYAAVFSTLASLLTLPFGWGAMSWQQVAMLVGSGLIGGVAQILLTEAFRNADVSVIAPFEYASLIFSIAIGYVVFGDVPTLTMLIGSVIVVAAGIFIILREHKLGLERGQARAVNPRF